MVTLLKILTEMIMYIRICRIWCPNKSMWSILKECLPFALEVNSISKLSDEEYDFMCSSDPEFFVINNEDLI